MPHELITGPSGRLALVEASSGGAGTELAKPVVNAFGESPSRGLLHLATNELQAHLPPALDYVRSFARTYLTQLCQTQAPEGTNDLPPTPAPADLATFVLQAPPMTGLEYLNADALAGWWADLDALVRAEIRRHAGGAQAYLSAKNPLWRFVGRVTLHLAENKRDADTPFAFLATYVSRLSAQGKAQHEPLSRALQTYAGAKNKPALLSLLVPLQRAAERSAFLAELVDSGDVYHPLAWSPQEAHRFLKDIPVFEESGLIVRVPDWWKPNHPPRATVDVKIDGRRGAKLGVDALLDFSVGVALDGETLGADEIRKLLDSVGGLVRLKGKWVEVDREKLAEALEQWKAIEGRVHADGLTFFEGMRLLSGASLDRDVSAAVPEAAREWTGLTAGPALRETLTRLSSPEARQIPSPPGLLAELRPYQRGGLSWLHFMTKLGLGACLADDMGLGKTVQVIALLLALKQERPADADPCLLVVPASLIANWKAEIERFAPSLKVAIAHPSEARVSPPSPPVLGGEGSGVRGWRLCPVKNPSPLTPLPCIQGRGGPETRPATFPTRMSKVATWSLRLTEC